MANIAAGILSSVGHIATAGDPKGEFPRCFHGNWCGTGGVWPNSTTGPCSWLVEFRSSASIKKATGEGY